MTGPSGVSVTAKHVSGVVVPLCVLAAALLWVDPALLAGATLALGTTFGLAYGYARYVGLDADGYQPDVDAEGITDEPGIVGEHEIGNNRRDGRRRRE